MMLVQYMRRGAQQASCWALSQLQPAVTAPGTQLWPCWLPLGPQSSCAAPPAAVTHRELLSDLDLYS